MKIQLKKSSNHWKIKNFHTNKSIIKSIFLLNFELFFFENFDLLKKLRYKLLKEDFERLLSEKTTQFDLKQDEIASLKSNLYNLK